MLLPCLHSRPAWLRGPSSGPANHLKRMDVHRDKIDSRIDADSVTKRQTLQTPTAEQRVWRLFYARRNKLAAVDQTNKHTVRLCDTSVPKPDPKRNTAPRVHPYPKSNSSSSSCVRARSHMCISICVATRFPLPFRVVHMY
ncbi:unnamed protein product, partial [Ectocarpus sp. 12 AP-2014]